MAEFAVTIIGSGSALPMHGRHPSAQVLQFDDLFCLIDCGESTQMRLTDFQIKAHRIKLILISHLHGDHFFGLPGLISSFSHLNRKEELIVFGPAGIKDLLDAIIKYTALRIKYPLTIIETEPTGLQSIWSKGNCEIMTFPLFHRIPCNGYLFREKQPVIKLNRERVKALHLTIEQIHQLQQGEDILVDRAIIPNEELTHGHGKPLSYAYCSDTSFDMRLLPSIQNVSVLYHETTFRNDLLTMADLTGHTTAGDAGRMALAAGVSCLITGHYSSRYREVEDLLLEARKHFPHVLEAVEGRKYNLRALGGGRNTASGGQEPIENK